LAVPFYLDQQHLTSCQNSLPVYHVLLLASVERPLLSNKLQVETRYSIGP
jgi:hypothetical protein